MAAEPPRPAFYALAPGGWRDYITLLHPPYTAWHLSYVVTGAALAPEFSVARLGPTLAAFFLAVGIGAHGLDELHGRPLGTAIPDRLLVALCTVAIAAAAGVGLYGAVTVDPWLGAFVAAGVLVVLAYNLELAGGRLHTDATFALAWGGFPLLTAYFAAAGRVRPEAVVAAAFATALSLAQRRLSSRARQIRRRVATLDGTLVLVSGDVEPVTREALTAGHEAALRALAAASVLLAVSLLVARVG